jgi:hypothetical protein
MSTPDELDPSRELITEFLRGDIDPEHAPEIFEDDILFLAVDRIEGADPDWILGQLSNRAWRADLRAQILGFMIRHYPAGQAILDHEGERQGSAEMVSGYDDQVRRAAQDGRKVMRLIITTDRGPVGAITYENGQLTGSSPDIQEIADLKAEQAGSPEAAFEMLRGYSNGYMSYVPEDEVDDHGH